MKRLSARQYATALDASLADATRAELVPIAERLMARLRKDRTVRFLPRILEQLRNLEAVRHGRTRVAIEAPSQKIADAFAEKLTKSEVTITVDPSLRRGIAVTVDDQRIDATLKGRLTQLHRSLVSHSL